jgi:small GTP-binding protein
MSETGYNVVFLGETSVGKTTLIHRQLGREFSPLHRATVGCQANSTTVQVLDRTVSLKLVDTAGQEKFISSIKFFARPAVVAAICFDPTPRDYRTTSWVDGAKPYVDVLRDVNPDCLMIAIATKHDERQDGVPALAEITRLVKNRLGIDGVIETSGKTGYGVDDAFQEIARIASGSSQRIPTQTIIMDEAATVQTGAGGCGC